MNLGEKKRLSEVKWHFLVIYALIAAAAVTAAGMIIASKTGKAEQIPILLWLIGAVISIAALAVAIFAILLLAYENIKSISSCNEKLDNIAEMSNKNKAVLTQVSQAVRLSEPAKAIIFRDTDRETLRQMVWTKLHQEDFPTTYTMIDDIAKQTEYEELAEQLRAQADKYRDATEDERINQTITYIEKLFEQYHWAQASVQINRLTKAYPDSEKVGAMVQKLYEKKNQRKKELLAEWDEAVKRQETDRSLEILKELDLYLTPNEGLALQESARDVFRTKLHNLGVEFSLAVTEQQWAAAFAAGQQIIRDFPNSRMAREIREKIDILQERAQQQ